MQANIIVSAIANVTKESLMICGWLVPGCRSKQNTLPKLVVNELLEPREIRLRSRVQDCPLLQQC
jgi:hypothetical protein